MVSILLIKHTINIDKVTRYNYYTGMTERTSERIIQHLPQDIWAFWELGVPLHSSVAEEKIAVFCRGCDQLKPDGVCYNGPNDQARYAARLVCGWASIKDVQGTMTVDGFIPRKEER